MTALTLRCALRAKPYPCQFFGGLHGVLLMVRDVSGLIEGHFTVNWAGVDALDFATAHAAELVAGRCVDLTINRIHLFQRDIRADVLSCTLAPLSPSWQFNAGGTLKGQYQRVWTAPEDPAKGQTPPVAQATPAQAATKTIA